MRSAILKSVNQSILAVSYLKSPQALNFIEAAAELLIACFKAEGKVLVAGNGGSLCDAAHFAEELTGFFSSLRRAPLPALALTEPGHMSCVANDIGYEWVFARGVAAFGRPGDVLVVLTTSGCSPSIIRAVEEAKKKQLRTIAFLGKDGGDLRGMTDLEMIIEGFTTSDRIQEAHMTALHIIVSLIEQRLFSTVASEAPWN